MGNNILKSISLQLVEAMKANSDLCHKEDKAERWPKDAIFSCVASKIPVDV